MSDIRGSDGALWDLTYYLKHLTEEVSLGSDIQLGDVMRRVRHRVRTESGEPAQGIRVAFSEEDAARYEVDHIDFAPNPELGRIAADLRELIGEIHDDHRRTKNQGGEA